MKFPWGRYIFQVETRASSVCNYLEMENSEETFSNFWLSCSFTCCSSVISLRLYCTVLLPCQHLLMLKHFNELILYTFFIRKKNCILLLIFLWFLILDNAIQSIILGAPWFKSSHGLCAYISCSALREVDTSKLLSEILQDHANGMYDFHLRILTIDVIWY